MADTDAAAQIEDLLAAMSLLVNGGSLADASKIVGEVNAALGGNEKSAGHLIGEVDQATTTLNSRTGDITRMLDDLDSIAATLVKREKTIDGALTDFSPAARALADQTDEFVVMLESFQTVSSDAQDVVTRSQTDLVGTLDSIGPVLDGFSAIGADLGPALDDLVLFGNFFGKVSRGQNLTGTGRFSFDEDFVAGLPALSGSLSGLDSVGGASSDSPPQSNQQPEGPGPDKAADGLVPLIGGLLTGTLSPKVGTR